MSSTSETWASRLHAVLGGRIAEVDERALKGLIDREAKESADLGFKRDLYGSSKDSKRSLAGDVAAMANERGGLIIIGLDEHDGVAGELSPVELSEAEELRMKQIVADTVTPHVPFEILQIPAEADPDTGYLLLVVPPSPDRPHAVVADRGLRYPKRDGASTRWLRESEVAAEYRARERRGESQLDRLEEVHEEGRASLDFDEAQWLTLAVMPTNAGRAHIDPDRLKEMAEWAESYAPMRGNSFTQSFFYDHTAGKPSPAIRFNKYALRPVGASDMNRKAHYRHSELHLDGAGYAAIRVAFERQGRTLIMASAVPPAAVMALRLVTAHAIQNAGAFGDAVAEMRFEGQALALAYDFHGFPEPFDEDADALVGPIVARQTYSLDSAMDSEPDLLSVAGSLINELVQAFGQPSFEQLDRIGTLNPGFYPEDVRNWAAETGIPVREG